MAAAIILLEEAFAGVILPMEVISLVKDTAGVSTSPLAGPPPSQVATASRRLPLALRMDGSSGVPQQSENSSG